MKQTVKGGGKRGRSVQQQQSSQETYGVYLKNVKGVGSIAGRDIITTSHGFMDPQDAFGSHWPRAVLPIVDTQPPSPPRPPQQPKKAMSLTTARCHALIGPYMGKAMAFYRDFGGPTKKWTLDPRDLSTLLNAGKAHIGDRFFEIGVDREGTHEVQRQAMRDQLTTGMPAQAAAVVAEFNLFVAAYKAANAGREPSPGLFCICDAEPVPSAAATGDRSFGKTRVESRTTVLEHEY